MHYTKAKAIESLPPITDQNLYLAIDFALWLYLDMRSTLQNAVNKAATKYSIKPKVKIERLLREAVPEEVIWARANQQGMKSSNKASPDAAIRHSKMKKLESESKAHIANITNYF